MMNGHSAVHQTDSRAVGRRIIRLFQIRLSRLMVLVAIVAILFSAWLYHSDNRSDQRAWTSNQILGLRDPDAARRRQAAENLYSVERNDLARTVASLAGALGDPDWQVRRAAARSLAAVIRTAIGSSGATPNGDLTADINLAVRSLIPACRDARDEVRIEAQQALGSLFEKARPSGFAASVPLTKSVAVAALEAVSRGMEDASPKERTQAVWSFARVGPVAGAGDDPIKRIAENDPDPKVRIAAIGALSVGWPEDLMLYPLLLRRLKVVSDLEEHANIAWTFGSLACPPYEVLPALLDALSTDDWILRRTIPDALRKLGAAARPALPALARVAQIELADENDALAAIDAIVMIDPDSTEAQALVKPLAALLRDSPSLFARQQAAFRLMKFGPSAAAAVATLRDALKSRNPDVRERASLVLARIGAAARSAMPDVAALARDDPTPSVRQAAQQAADKIDRSGRLQRMPSP
jgi:HEAT repeat protein